MHQERSVRSRRPKAAFEPLEARQLLSNVFIDVKATGVTGAGASITNGGKTVSVPEGGTVTFTTYISNVPGSGLFSFDAGLRTSGERYGNTAIATNWPNPSPTDTVLNAIGSEFSGVGVAFDTF